MDMKARLSMSNSSLSSAAKTLQKDEGDGFEPLFDYSSVQPGILIDDDDSGDDVQFVQKGSNFRPNAVKHTREETVKESTTNTDVKDIEDEEDWLPPPPKSTKNRQVSVDGNSILSELRLRREELVSMTSEPPEEMLRKLEETTKKELQKAANSDSHDAGCETLESSTTRKKIVVSIQDKKGSKPFRIYVDDKFEKLFKAYAQHVHGQIENFVFCFDGNQISPSQNPQDFDMEEDDIIEVYSKA